MDSWSGNGNGTTNNFIRIYDIENTGANNMRFYQWRNFQCGINGLNSQYPKPHAHAGPQGDLGTSCMTPSHEFFWANFSGDQAVNLANSGNSNTGGDFVYMNNILENNNETHICISIEKNTTRFYKNGVLYHELYLNGASDGAY